VTFKELRKRVNLKTIHQNLYDRLRNKPFWIWDQQQHKKGDIETNEDCCFNRIIGLPKKEREEKPIFGYQKLLFDSIFIPNINNPLQHDFRHEHLWVKKATGLGVTGFFLRLMAWLCLKDDTYFNSQKSIVTVIIKITIKLIKITKHSVNLIPSDLDTASQ
jgi:hypothetical protein